MGIALLVGGKAAGFVARGKPGCGAASPPVDCVEWRRTTSISARPGRRHQIGPDLPGDREAAAAEPQRAALPAGRTGRPERQRSPPDVECQRSRLRRLRRWRLRPCGGHTQLFQGNDPDDRHRDRAGRPRDSRRGRLPRAHWRADIDGSSPSSRPRGRISNAPTTCVAESSTDASAACSTLQPHARRASSTTTPMTAGCSTTWSTLTGWCPRRPALPVDRSRTCCWWACSATTSARRSS